MKYDIEKILTMYEDDYNPSSTVLGPHNMRLVEILRSEMDNFNTPDLEQAPDSYLKPGETLEDFDVEFRRPNAEGGRMRFDKGGFTDADILEIKSKLPKGINIEYDAGSGRWRYMTSITQADGSKKRMRLPMLKAFDLEADENLKKILKAKGIGKEVFDLSLKIGGKTILTPEKFYELRLKDSKLSLDKFLEKLTKKGFVKPDGKPFGSRSALHRLQQDLGIADLVGGESNAARKRSIQDIKAIVRSAPNGPQILKSITDEKELRKIANALVSRDRLYERRGSFPVGRSKENKMWHNLWRASNTGDRIEIIGEFADGKLPIDSNGRVNWQMPNEDGVPAWKRVEFIDNQKNKAPLKWIDMPGSRSLGNQGQLRSQVDNIYGKGFFDRKMKPYDLQKQIGDLEIDLDGQKVKVGTILNENIVKSRLMDKLIKENNGTVPTEAEFNKRYNSYRNKLKLFNSMNVQHTKGVGLDPYTTELTTQSANAKERTIVQKYNAAIKKTTDPTELLKLSNNFADDINKIGGGIRSFDVQTGTVKGTKATPYSIGTQLVEEARLPEETKKIILSKFEELGCGKSAGGRIMFGKGTSCAIKGRKILEEGLKNGFKNKNQQVLATGILSSAKFLKDAVSLRGLFGPAALAFTVAAEAGIVGYDMLSTGKSFKEAVGDSVFNYMLGDKTKIDSEEEFIKRLKNIKTGPSGLRDFSDEEIGKMQYFKENLKDMGRGFDLYNQLKNITERQETERGGSQKDLFSENAFQLDAAEDKIRADIQDYNRTGTPYRVTDYLLSDKATAGADAAKKAASLVEQDQLQDAGTGKFYQAKKGDEKRLNRLNELKYDIEKMYNPTPLDPFREKFMSLPKGEQSTIMSYGYPRYMEGGIASLNVNKK